MRSAFCAAGVLCACACTLGLTTFGQELPSPTVQATPDEKQESEAAPADPAQSELGFRFSDEFFRTLLRRNVDRTSPVNQYILGAHVTGTARTTGDVDLLFQPSEDAAQFYILLTGQSVVNTVSVKGPARVYTTTVTHYRAWKLVRFDREGFVTSPAGIEATTCAWTRGIAATARLRLVNRVVQRAAAKRVAETRGYTTGLADYQTRRRIIQAFDEAVDRAIDEANLRLSIRQTLLERFGGLEGLVYRLSTTPRYVEVLVNIASDHEPKRPPFPETWSEAPMEIWIRTSLEDEILPPILRDWAPRYRFFIERGVQRFAQRITPEQIDFRLEFTPQLDWVVMRFGDELMERLRQRVEERRQREAGAN